MDIGKKWHTSSELLVLLCWSKTGLEDEIVESSGVCQWVSDAVAIER